MEEQLKTGDYKVQHVLENLRVCYVAVQGITDGPGKFYNINTPEEYRKIIPEKIKEKHSRPRLYRLWPIPAPVRRHFWKN